MKVSDYKSEILITLEYYGFCCEKPPEGALCSEN